DPVSPRIQFPAQPAASLVPRVRGGWSAAQGRRMKAAMRTIEINGLRVGAGLTHLIIAGPCVIEDAGLVLETAAELKRITTDLKLSFIFKASYDKANRSSGTSFRGPGLKEGLAVLAKVKETDRKSTRLNSSH